MSMKDKSRQESNRRGPRATHGYNERMHGHKLKITASEDGRDGNGSLARHQSMAVRPYEKERERDTSSYYQGSSHASKIRSSEEAQKAIHTLLKQVKDATSFFTSFKEDFQQEVHGIEAYAGRCTLEKLWDRRILYNDGKGRSNNDGVGWPPAFEEVSRRLWQSLNDAYKGARYYPTAQNDSLARKLSSAKSEVGRLTSSARVYFQEMDSLIKELKLLKVVLELGGAGTASNDDTAKQRHRARAAGHKYIRGSSLDPGDARYEGSREGSGSDDDDDDDQCDEKHGEQLEQSDEREESEAGGDGEGPDS